MPAKKIKDWLTVKEFKLLSENEQLKIINNFKELYITQLLNKEDILEKLNINKKLYGYIIKEYNIKLSNDLLQLKKKRNNLERHGNENYRNSEKAKQTWSNKSKEEMAERSRKIINSKLQKYGNKMGDIEKLKETRKNSEKVANAINTAKQTCLKRYNRLNYSQLSVPEHVYNILQDKESLKEEILKLGDKNKLGDLSDALGHHSAIIGRYVRRYNLEYLIDYSKNVYHSKQELEIQSFLESYNIKFKVGDRTQIKPLELDIYIPDYQVAIEFNGTYWHSARYKDKDYHYNKSKLCEEKGIRLIHIWEYEWNNPRQRPILENIILSACGKIENKIYARKCTIEVRESKSMEEFFDNNNIQGFRGGKFAICLVYNNEVVMSYMMGNAFFGKGKYEWEVIRGATKINTTIIGGASKIWKYFKDTYHPKSCVYYIDYNYFNGNSIKYLDENFKFIRKQLSFKNYFIEENIIKNRQPQKHKEIKELEKQGLVVPVYNAGTKVYVWENNKI